VNQKSSLTAWHNWCAFCQGSQAYLIADASIKNGIFSPRKKHVLELGYYIRKGGLGGGFDKKTFKIETQFN
jgi:hypothetical protein